MIKVRTNSNALAPLVMVISPYPKRPSPMPSTSPIPRMASTTRTSSCYLHHHYNKKSVEDFKIAHEKSQILKCATRNVPQFKKV